MRSIVQGLADKSATPQEVLRAVDADRSLLPDLFEGVSSPSPAVRYGSAKVLVELCKTSPCDLYPSFHFFVGLLSSTHRILVWNGLAALAYLSRVDTDRRFDDIVDAYYAHLFDGYLVTAANVVSHSATIVQAKPYMADRVAAILLKIPSLPTGPHLTAECKRVLAEKAIDAFDAFYDAISDKEAVRSFATTYRTSSRPSLRRKATAFLKKRGG